MAAKQNEDVLTARERKFVEQYIVDFRATNAAIRSGIPKLNARKTAEGFLQDGRVMLEIHRLIDEAKKEELAHPNRVIAGLIRESHDMRNSGAERVSALKALAVISKLTKHTPKGDEPGNDLPGGVMEVPGMLDAEAFSKVAGASQRALKEKVRD